MTIQLNIAGQTDVGRQRRDNQDTFISRPLWSDRDALLVVIDGVGGYAGGAEAASLAREAINQYMAAPTGDALTMLREAVVHANNQIVRQRQQDPALARMCCVLTAAIVNSDTKQLFYAHVGDTRLYRFRQGQLEKLTHDHSLVGVREDTHQLTESEAMSHPRRNEILRDVGSAPHRVDDPDFLESGETNFLPGDALLLCSDGLTDMLTRAGLTEVLSQPMPVADQINELIRRANEAGGNDNITIVLAQFPAMADEPDPVLPAVIAPVSETSSTPAPVALVTTEMAPVRKWGLGTLLVLCILVLAGVLWWQYGTSAKNAKTQPMPTDSSTFKRATNQPDSLRTP